jgi:hypothetical protein
VITDLNRDGQPDLAVANNESDSVSLLYGSGPANFAPAIAFPVNAGPLALSTVDINTDLRPDLLVCSGIDDLLTPMIAVAPIGIERGVEFATGTGPSGIATPDLDGDGRADLVVTNSFDGTISVFLGEANGMFAPLADLVTGGGFDSGPLGIAWGDFSGDHHADVVVANQMEDTVTVFSGDGTGAFDDVRTFDADSLPTTARVAELTGDGVPDLVVVNEGSDTAVVLIGDGAGGIRDRITLETGGFPESVAVRDLNGDGLPEIVTADSFSDVVSVFRARGAGAFDERIAFPVGRSPFDVVIGDFNRDGRPDVATANLDDDTVSILLNTTAYEAARGDFDGDNLVDQRDVVACMDEMFDGDGDLSLQVERGLKSSGPASDANGDGFVSVSDLLAQAAEISRRGLRRERVDAPLATHLSDGEGGGSPH